jgi:PIN domain nuclease of toxin-antitoxin system
VGSLEVILLDTHVLVWIASDDRKLGRKSRALISRYWDSGNIAVCAVTFWEIGLLQARGRIALPMEVSAWREDILNAGLIELPLNGAIAVRALDLSGLPDDPADRFITATALVHGAALLTADERLLKWRHALERHDAAA